jgi:hypothetical protein
MFWSFGGDINVLPDYHILNPNDTFTQLYMALHLLGLMSWNNKSIIPRNSTIDPAELNRRSMFSTAPWLFARQWHSTFVEYLTCDKKKLTITRFLKKNKSADFEIMPIPVSLFSYLARDKIPEHTSCWGDWHFAITDGSENLELGISVINNLMSSRKIPERAFSMADLPTVEKFYKLYGDVKCFNSHRMPSERLPSVTFNDMRSGYFKNAKSRTQIFDYRHTMRELAAVIRFAHFGAFSSCPMNDDIIPDNTFNKKVYRRLYKAFENIDNFKYDNIMIS